MTENTWAKAVSDFGSQTKAASALGVARSTIQRRLKRETLGLPVGAPTYARQKSEPGVVIPEGYVTKGTSTLYDEHGNAKLQWVKTKIDPDAMSDCLSVMREEFARDIPRYKPSYRAPTSKHDDLMTAYILTDFHLGMLAWHEETGSDWNIHIAEKLLIDYFTHAVSVAPSSRKGVLANIGDLLHWDSMEAVTPSSRHVVDGDTRYQKLIRVAIRACKIAVRIMLEKHDEVHVIHATGNHDTSGAAWLRECFHGFYEDDPRVTVEVRPDPYYMIEHGKTSVFFHHGHRRNIANIDSVFAGKFREVFGRTKYSYGHIGHLHNSHRIETNLMIVERHPTLASPDAYAAGGGWLSSRSASAITYSKKYGEISRIMVTPEMFSET